MQVALAIVMMMTMDARGSTPAAVTPAKPKVARSAPDAPRIEVAFVLDTTGSMSGLIEGAKRRIWTIARQIGAGRPRPDLRIALVGYRDKGDQYVTRVHPFSADMDEVYQSLSSFHADGGGDTPEHVSAALHDAVEKLAWSADERTLKVLFLVGDAPPHTDYQDQYDYRRHVADARARGIVVDAIQCGADGRTASVWREIAAAGLGHYARIEADGGMNVAVTSHDAELARLGAELSSTVVVSGAAGARQAAEDKMAARRAMPSAVAAEAAGYLADAPKVAEADLVDRPVAEQRRELRQNAAPALAGKPEAEALADLAARKAKRADLQARIQALQKKREAELAATGKNDAFDEEVVAKMKERAGKKGVAY